jgi:formate hydrogenlyase subunit 3/multisubunit Na+/H+ antiporter MnhD subunit
LAIPIFFRTFASNKIFRIMITNFLIIAFITLIVSVLLLVGVCVYYFVVDEYDMEDSMKKFKETCKVSDWSISVVFWMTIICFI